MSPSHTPHRLLVWDLPTRLFHWALVILVTAAWFTAEMSDDLMDYHAPLGYGVLTLLLFRLAWGFVGSTHSRFSDFIRLPGKALEYLRDMKAGRPSPYLGHNPLGGWMVACLLLALLAQAATGLFTSDEIMNEGPFYHLVSGETGSLLTQAHEMIFNLLTGLVAVHVCAVLAYRLIKRENLVLPMITGHKTLQGPGPEPRTASLWLAILLLAASGSMVWALVVLA